MSTNVDEPKKDGMGQKSQQSLPETVRYGGSALLMGWFLLFFSGEIWGLDYEYAAESVAYVSLISIACCFITLLILNVFATKRNESIKAGGYHFFALGAILSAGTTGIAFGYIVPSPIFVVSCMAVGCAGAFFISAAILQLARLEPRGILVTCGVIFLLGIFVYSFAFYVPRALTVPILCLLPFAASLFFAFDRTEVARASSTAGSAAEKGRAPIGWRAVVLFSVFMLFSCVVRGYLPFYIDNEEFSYVRSFSIVLMLIMAAIVVIVPAVLPESMRTSVLYRGLFIVGVVLFALFPIFGMDNTIVLVLADGYRGLCALMTLAFFAFMARQMPFFGFRYVGGGLAIYIAFGFIGWLLGLFLHNAGFTSDVLRVYSSIQCVIVLLAFIVLYRQSDGNRFVDLLPAAASGAYEGEGDAFTVGDRQNNTPQNGGGQHGYATFVEEGGGVSQPGDQEESGGRWRQHLVAVAEEKGLTAREEEVFILLAKGFKARNISERLSVSYNTTRAHIRNIYQKCDVHSQQEFVDLIETSTKGREG